MNQIWWVDELPLFWAARTWRAGVDWQTTQEIAALFPLAKKAIREYREREQKGPMLTREMVLRALHHRYEPGRMDSYFDDEYLNTIRARAAVERVESQGTVSILDLEAPSSGRVTWTPWWDMDRATGFLRSDRHWEPDRRSDEQRPATD